MIEFLKSNFTVGDPIEITTDTETVQGQIEFIGPDYIVLRLSNNQVKGISESGIRTFSSISEQTRPDDARDDAAPEKEEEQEKSPTEPSPEEREPAKPFTKYKPGDRVPL